MKFPLFASLIILFCLWLGYEIYKSNKKNKKLEESFWEKEDRANATRPKPLDDLNFIDVPDFVFESLSRPTPSGLEDCAKMLSHLKEARIVNLSYITNTDLKLKYGVANLPLLTEYDQNYITLIRVLQLLGEYHYENGNVDTCRALLEFAVSIQSDNISTYKMLANIYHTNNETLKIDYLVSSASLLPGLTRKPILRFLEKLRSEDTNPEESILDILD